MAGAWLIRDVFHRLKHKRVQQLVQYWRSSMLRLTQRVLHDSILAQETLENVGRKLWLRCVRDTTWRWYREVEDMQTGGKGEGSARGKGIYLDY